MRLYGALTEAPDSTAAAVGSKFELFLADAWTEIGFAAVANFELTFAVVASIEMDLAVE